MLVTRVLNMASNFSMLVVILVQIPSFMRAAPNNLSTVQVGPKIHFLSMGTYCNFQIRRMKLSFPLSR